MKAEERSKKTMIINNLLIDAGISMIFRRDLAKNILDKLEEYKLSSTNEGVEPQDINKFLYEFFPQAKGNIEKAISISPNKIGGLIRVYVNQLSKGTKEQCAKNAQCLNKGTNINTPLDDKYQEFFNFMSQEHNLTLLQSEINEIIVEVDNLKGTNKEETPTEELIRLRYEEFAIQNKIKDVVKKIKTTNVEQSEESKGITIKKFKPAPIDLSGDIDYCKHKWELWATNEEGIKCFVCMKCDSYDLEKNILNQLSNNE